KQRMASFKVLRIFREPSFVWGTETIGQDLYNTGITRFRINPSTKTDDILKSFLFSSSLNNTPSATKNSASPNSSSSLIRTKSKNPRNIDRTRSTAGLALLLVLRKLIIFLKVE